MTRTGWIKAGAAATACAAVGAAAGIAGTAASPQHAKAPSFRKFDRGHRGARFAGAGGPPVHIEAVVPKRGGGFQTVTGDNGKLKSRSGNDLTITEGTSTDTYKDATITVPDGATIVRNGKKATLDDLKEGDFVRVMRSPSKTFVMAFDANFRPRFGHRRFGHRMGRPGFRGRPAPPPPYGP